LWFHRACTLLLLIATLLLGWASGPQRACAQAAQPAPMPAPAAKPTPSAEQRATKREYERTIRAALLEYQLAHWDEAAALFARAHALNPSARTLRGLGLAAFESRNYALALGYMRAALADPRRPLTREQRAELEQASARSASFVARVVLVLQPASATFTLDGNPAQLDAHQELLLDPGDHELLVSAPGHEQRSVLLRAAAGTSRRLAVALTPLSAPALTAAHEPEPGQLRYTWVAAAGVPVFGALALGIWLTGQGELGEIEDDCRAMGGCSEPEIARRADDAGLSSRATWTSVCLMLTGAAAGTAAALYLIESRAGDERAPSATLSVGPGAVALRGRF
jgi:hypothetical protein